MKIINPYQAKHNQARKGDVVVTQDRILMLREASKDLSGEDICARCAIRGDLCKKVLLLCGPKGFFVDIEPTEEIDRVRDLFALKGELL